MQIKGNANKSFEPCPEYTGRAVCVDVTDLKPVNTEYGPKDVFRIVFEVDLQQTLKVDGKEEKRPWCVWSRGFTPNLGDKAALRKFLIGWFGRDLTEAEVTMFETESLIGKPAFLVITHTTKGDEVYANIASCTPDRSVTPLVPSGKFVRQKDRQKQSGIGKPGDASYRRTETPAVSTAPEDPQASYLTTKVHVGRFKGTELRELAKDSVENLVRHWLPVVRQNPKPTADDRRLMAALEWFAAQQEAAAAQAEEAAAAAAQDDLQY